MYGLKMLKINGLSLRWKIYLIAMVSLIGFGSYLGFNVWVNTKNADLLRQLRESNFPVLEKSTQNRVNIERLAELLNNAAMTAESDYLDRADELAKKVNTIFDAIVETEPERKAGVTGIKSKFNAYFADAKSVTVDMMSGDLDQTQLTKRGAAKEAKMVQVKNDLDEFIAYAHYKFSESINTANANANTMLTFGFGIWLVCIIIMGVTCYAIAFVILGSINRVSDSLSGLAHGGNDFSGKIAVTSADEIGKLAESFNELLENLRIKTSDLMSMMRSMHTGLFTIMADEKIHHEYSSHIEYIFECADVAGRNYAEFLFSNAGIGSDVRNQVCTAVSSLLGEDEMMFEFNSHLLIGEFTIQLMSDANAVRSKILEVDWDPIIIDGVITKIMVSIRDVTEVRAMQAAAEKQKVDLEIVGQILKLTPQRFREFADNAFALIDRNRKIISQNSQKNENVVAELFANMHTVKGNARTYQLNYITDVVHEVEFTYDCLRKGDTHPWVQNHLLNELERVREAVGRYMNVFKEKLDFPSQGASLPVDSLLIKKSRLNSVISRVESVLAERREAVHLAPILNDLRWLDSKSLPQVLSGMLTTLPDIARQLNKIPPRIRFEGNVVYILSAHADSINNVFSHVLKNAIDHGIETPEERRASGKHEAGTITIKTTEIKRKTMITISDDGRGLNVKRLREKLLEQEGVDAGDLTPQNVANGMFMSGISTANALTDISGRGVGMDAVKRYLNAIDSDIAIALDTSADVENLSFVSFCLIITIGEGVGISTVHESEGVLLENL